MTFSEDQKRDLAKPLDRATVKSRKQGSMQVSYIEGWHDIAEANRIFGFDGWSRETVDIRCVAEKPRDIGQAKNAGHGVTYIAKVRVNVGGIIREGCGSGHGIDRDLGQAHESAIKEAETDAMKRALMTFGNQFGLALYDKTQENVIERLPKKDAREIYKRLQAEIDLINIRADFDQWCADNEGRIQVLPEDWESILRLRMQEHRVDVQRIEKMPHDTNGETVWTDDTPPEWDSAWEKLGPVKQAGVLCGDVAFRMFIGATDADAAAAVVRSKCCVASRKELATNEAAAKVWRSLVADYRAWQREPAIVDASASGMVSFEDEARKQAKRGSAMFATYWKNLDETERAQLKPFGDELRSLMNEADAG